MGSGPPHAKQLPIKGGGERGPQPFSKTPNPFSELGAGAPTAELVRRNALGGFPPPPSPVRPRRPL
ncbi:hypothetical protein COCOBI_pt-1580 (chloroplast) [Coccomyxa sp. Obi]|nr:hypothetical protein COCOBI_pt-1580 [Coccomyxa sp. Obi]